MSGINLLATLSMTIIYTIYRNTFQIYLECHTNCSLYSSMKQFADWLTSTFSMFCSETLTSHLISGLVTHQEEPRLLDTVSFPYY